MRTAEPSASAALCSGAFPAIRPVCAKTYPIAAFTSSSPAGLIANRACAVIREGAQRVFGFKHHAVQVAGALAMYDGCIAEMATGEGKTLTATIPALLAAWRGRGCHVITVNDYLASRDSGEMGKLFHKPSVL